MIYFSTPLVKYQQYKIVELLDLISVTHFRERHANWMLAELLFKCV